MSAALALAQGTSAVSRRNASLAHPAAPAKHVGAKLHLASTHRPDGTLVTRDATGRIATIDLDYERSGNTHDQPQSRWVLSKVTVFDGHPGEGADTSVTTLRYEGGFFHRLEREFYGYARVIEEHRDTENFNALYRTITREFLNDSFYRKGLLKRELVQDSAGAPFTETEHTYVLRNVDTGLAPANALSTTATVFPELARTDRRFYEGNPSPGKTTFTTHAYDRFGNVVRFFDAGEAGAADDIDATIGYSTDCALSTYVIKPNVIRVLGGGVESRRREADIDCATGNVTQVRAFVNGQAAVTRLFYEANGNLSSVERPPNRATQRYTLSYKYDNVVATHVIQITDSLPLAS